MPQATKVHVVWLGQVLPFDSVKNSRTLHGSAMMFTYIGVVSGVNVGIYLRYMECFGTFGYWGPTSFGSLLPPANYCPSTL